LGAFKVIFSCLISNFDGSAMKRHKFTWYLSGKLVVIVPKILELNLFLTLEVVWTVLSLFSQLMNQSLLHWMEHVKMTLKDFKSDSHAVFSIEFLWKITVLGMPKDIV
jgi:hypothetical protein